MNDQQRQQAYAHANQYRRLVLARTGLSPDELVCPRESSAMTPCIARDGGMAVADSNFPPGGVCVGCDRGVDDLLDAEKARKAD